MTSNFTEGEVLLVDKPMEWTSFDVVNKLRSIIKQKEGKKTKVGHAGTLDPLATGLLILCTGKMTKQISGIQDQEKEYTGEIFLGATTASYDLESDVENIQDASAIKISELEAARDQLSGTISQMPPAFSAKKVDGTRAYKLARKGKEVNLRAKEVKVYEFELCQVELPIVKFRIRCSKGTYIRSIAHDFGQILKVGAYLKELRRTKIGDYNVDSARTITEWEASLRASS
jgi:tRNA pseudouridine55 synthase